MHECFIFMERTDAAAIFLTSLFSTQTATTHIAHPRHSRWRVELKRQEPAVSSEARNVEILKEACKKWHETRGGSVDHFIDIVDADISFGSLPRGAAPMQFATQYDNR